MDDWRNGPIPDDVLDRAAAEMADVARRAQPPLGKPGKTTESPQIAVRVLVSLIEECEKNDITHLPIATLKAALERWL